MKLSLFALATLALTSSASFAQQGSSNGSKNRDSLPSVKVNLSQEKLPQTIDEALDALRARIADLKTITIPDYQSAGEEFWNGLDPADIALIKQAGVKILNVIDESSQLLEPIKSSVSHELGVIQAFSSEEANFKKQGLRREWRNRVSALRADLTDDVTRQIYHTTDVLFRLGGTAFEYRQEPDNILSVAAPHCRTLKCIKLLENLGEQYDYFLAQYKATKIQVPGLIESVKIGKLNPSYHFYERELKLAVTRSTQKAVLTVTEALIRSHAQRGAKP